MDYENDFEMCEYNPMAVQYQKEIAILAEIIEKPAMSFFEKLMRKIVLTYGTTP